MSLFSIETLKTHPQFRQSLYVLNSIFVLAYVTAWSIGHGCTRDALLKLRSAELHRPSAAG